MSLERLTYIFYFLYLIFPEYFALEISSSFPLLTAGRICILVLLFAHIIVNNGTVKLVYMPKDLKIYFLLIFLVNIFHLVDVPTDSIKAIFNLVFEQMLFISLIIVSLNTREKVKNALKFMVYGSFVVCICGIYEVIVGENLFYELSLVNREMLQASYERLGLLRAEGPFGHPVYYGVYCISMLPFSLYFYKTEKRRRFLFISLLNILGTVFSSSRGQILVLGILLVYMFMKQKQTIKTKYLAYFFVMFPFFSLILVLVPSVFENILEIIKSTLNAIGFNFQTGDFGTNANGIYSRLVQLSGIKWTFMQNAWVIGFGENAHTNGLVRYLTIYGWSIRRTFDVGYVAIFMKYGILGTVGYFFLYRFLAWKSYKFQRKSGNENLYSAFWFFSFAYLLNLFTTTGVSRMLIIVIAVFAAYDRCFSDENKEV